MKIYTNKKICIKHTRMIADGNGDRGEEMTTEMKNSVENLDDKVGETSYKIELNEKEKKSRLEKE